MSSCPGAAGPRARSRSAVQPPRALAPHQITPSRIPSVMRCSPNLASCPVASATFTELPIPPDTAPIGFIAASPDASKLAISTYVRHGPAGDIQNLTVASTATGAERRWTTPAQDSQGSMDTMAWLADGRTLAFNWTGASETSPWSSLRLLDSSVAGDDLLSS